MRSGELRDLIDIQQATSAQGAAGGMTQTWATFVKLKAAIIEDPGSEGLGPGQETAVARVTFTTHYKTGVTAAMRIVWDSRTFDILSVTSTRGLRRELILRATQRHA